MPHSDRILERVKVQVVRDYSPSAFDFQIEGAAVVRTPRVHADLLVREKKTNKIACVVEIGYTRPEKLTIYALTLGIPDVRWYRRLIEENRR